MSDVYNMVPAMGPGEQVLWELQITKGIIRKEVVGVFRITNYRVVHNKKAHGLAMVEDILVMNSHGVSRGQYISTGRYVRVGFGNSKSRTVGDVVFMYQGKPIIIFSQIGDPHGVARLAKSSRKAALAQVKAEMVKQGVKTMEELRKGSKPQATIPKLEGERDVTGPACPKCGAATLDGASFCAQCGLPL